MNAFAITIAACQRRKATEAENPSHRWSDSPGAEVTESCHRTHAAQWSKSTEGVTGVEMSGEREYLRDHTSALWGPG